MSTNPRLAAQPAPPGAPPPGRDEASVPPLDGERAQAVCEPVPPSAGASGSTEPVRRLPPPISLRLRWQTDEPHVRPRKFDVAVALYHGTVYLMHKGNVFIMDAGDEPSTIYQSLFCASFDQLQGLHAIALYKRMTRAHAQPPARVPRRDVQIVCVPREGLAATENTCDVKVSFLAPFLSDKALGLNEFLGELRAAEQGGAPAPPRPVWRAPAPAPPIVVAALATEAPDGAPAQANVATTQQPQDSRILNTVDEVGACVALWHVPGLSDVFFGAGSDWTGVFEFTNDTWNLAAQALAPHAAAVSATLVALANATFEDRFAVAKRLRGYLPVFEAAVVAVLEAEICRIEALDGAFAVQAPLCEHAYKVAGTLRLVTPDLARLRDALIAAESERLSRCPLIAGDCRARFVAYDRLVAFHYNCRVEHTMQDHPAWLAASSALEETAQSVERGSPAARLAALEELRALNLDRSYKAQSALVAHLAHTAHSSALIAGPGPGASAALAESFEAFAALKTVVNKLDYRLESTRVALTCAFRKAIGSGTPVQRSWPQALGIPAFFVPCPSSERDSSIASCLPPEVLEVVAARLPERDAYKLVLCGVALRGAALSLHFGTRAVCVGGDLWLSRAALVGDGKKT